MSLVSWLTFYVGDFLKAIHATDSPILIPDKHAPRAIPLNTFSTGIAQKAWKRMQEVEINSTADTAPVNLAVLYQPFRSKIEVPLARIIPNNNTADIILAFIIFPPFLFYFFNVRELGIKFSRANFLVVLTRIKKSESPRQPHRSLRFYRKDVRFPLSGIGR